MCECTSSVVWLIIGGRCTDGSKWKVWPDVVYPNTAVCGSGRRMRAPAYITHWPRSESTFNPVPRRTATFTCHHKVTGKSVIVSDEQKGALAMWHSQPHFMARTDGIIVYICLYNRVSRRLRRLHKQARLTHFQVLWILSIIRCMWVWGSINREKRAALGPEWDLSGLVWCQVAAVLGSSCHSSPAVSVYVNEWKIALF